MSTPLTSSFGLRGDAAAVIASRGSRFDEEVLGATRALFAPGWDSSLPPGAARHVDVPYGAEPRQTFDLFVPATPNSPIVIYVPGGGFTGGDKSGYTHIGAWFCRRGFLTAILNYRLAPVASWPAGAQDVAAAIDAIAQVARTYGGDSMRIFVLGQSAGATHCCAALLDGRFQPRHLAAVRRLILLSGVYRMDTSLTHPGVRAYFGADPATYPDRSPVNFIGSGGLPVELAIAEYDLPFVVASGLDLALALTLRDRKSPPVIWLRGHNHVSAVLALGTSGDELAEALACTFAASPDQARSAE